ncbi:hypothetical protein Pmani_028204 [Petrolisthes manimaculis]|uniref:Uncharacterized protein n=1 Tax=Petrolisthes manimaculis TaxID=1843537 RepID=A0AAE1TVQ5_9EUCA|nr:hypothetical protein Pmani_028204 [Petrolisthes manimaculis]
MAGRPTRNSGEITTQGNEEFVVIDSLMMETRYSRNPNTVLVMMFQSPHTRRRDLDGRVFVVPSRVSFEVFSANLRSMANLREGQVLNFAIDGLDTVPRGSRSMDILREEFVAPDGFIHIIYSDEHQQLWNEQQEQAWQCRVM